MSEEFNTPLPSAEFTPEELAEASAMRPLEAIPSSWTVKGDPAVTKFVPKLEAFSPSDQKAVRELAGPNATGEQLQSALMTFLKSKSAEARIIAGAGAGATEPEREALEQLGQIQQLERERNRIEDELSDVIRHDTVIGADGMPEAVPVFRYQGQALTQRTYRIAEIAQEIADLKGARGDRAMQEAVRREADNRRQIKNQLEEAEEAKRRAETMVREERVNAAAKTRANMLRNS